MIEMKRPDFIEYFTDVRGRTHIRNVYCKCCGTLIQRGDIVRDREGVPVPRLRPTDQYVDLYVACEARDGTHRRKSTPVCSDCASRDIGPDELEAIHRCDCERGRERHAHSGNLDPKVIADMEDRESMRPIRKIGYCVPGYAITGEGR
ncbi:MAG: hypothetical protein A2093_07610 [Caulobacterales bacterium GWE1_67_11]|nr:MAG: hypothetical protein A2093_07610 [Caulobacterales bacterium GWE1_67_11]